MSLKAYYYFILFEMNILYMVKINSFTFGSLTINNRAYDTDMIVCWDGEMMPRESSHTFTKGELIELLVKGIDTVIIGTGTAGCVKIEKDAEDFARTKNVRLIYERTPEAIQDFNNMSRNRKVIAVIHVTC